MCVCICVYRWRKHKIMGSIMFEMWLYVIICGIIIFKCKMYLIPNVCVCDKNIWHYCNWHVPKDS